MIVKLGGGSSDGDVTPGRCSGRATRKGNHQKQMFRIRQRFCRFACNELFSKADIATPASDTRNRAEKRRLVGGGKTDWLWVMKGSLKIVCITSSWAHSSA